MGRTVNGVYLTNDELDEAGLPRIPGQDSTISGDEDDDGNDTGNSGDGNNDGERPPTPAEKAAAAAAAAAANSNGMPETQAEREERERRERREAAERGQGDPAFAHEWPDLTHGALTGTDYDNRDVWGAPDNEGNRNYQSGQSGHSRADAEKMLKSWATEYGKEYDPNDLNLLMAKLEGGSDYIGAQGGDPNLAFEEFRSKYQREGQSGGDRGNGGYDTRWDDDDERRFSGPTPAGYTGKSWQPGAAGGDGAGTLGGYGAGTLGGGFQWPEFTPTALGPGTPFDMGAPFEHEAFVAPTMEDAENEPGYAFGRKEGLRALENSAAAQGMARSGGTLKDFIGWGNQFAEQNYGNVYGRAANTHGIQRGDALETHNTNLTGRFNEWAANEGQRHGDFDRTYRSEYDQFQPKQRSAELTFDDLYRRWRDELDSTTRIATAGAGL